MHAACFHPRARRVPVKDSPRFLGADPSITTTPQEGVVSSLTTLSYYGTPTVTPSYQWLLDTVAIGGATSATYTPQTGDATHTLQCDITLTGPAGTTPVTKRTAGLVVSAAAGGGTGTATIGWDDPILDGDGAALSDLANFKVYWGYASGVYTANSGLLPTNQSSTISVALHSYTASGLTNGQTVYMAVVAVDSGGNESFFSTEMSKAIP